MAIGFARIEFVKRSSGKNACAKSAYNSRSDIVFKGTDLQKQEKYSWSNKEQTAHSDVMLPENADPKFKNRELLWNTVESWEVKSNAQVAMEVVLALPDDKIVSIEDKIKLARNFVEQYFVKNGLAAQIDVHAPDPLLIITRDNVELGLKKGMKGSIISKTADKITFELEEAKTDALSFNPKEFTGYIEKEHNWHAHVLLTTRRFKENGLEFADHKARDLMPRISMGRVTSGPDWGKLWAQHQNNYFQENGIEVRVDSNNIVPQEHLGPFRMRGRAFSMLEENQRLIEVNKVEVKDPVKLLQAVTSQKSIFSKEDVSDYLMQHITADEVTEVLENFWKQPDLVQLVDKKTGELLSGYTSKTVIEEEQQILRLADRIYGKESFKIRDTYSKSGSNGLNEEQTKAFYEIIQGKKLSLIQGYAGTGKSYLLKALHTTYQEAGYSVRALGPDNATADILKEKGLSNTENVFKFLFALRNDRRKILKGKEVWILDEAGKLGNRALLEFLREAEKKDVKVVLSGDVAQMPPVERGGMFKVFCEQYGPQSLSDIQRQKADKQLEIARSLARGEFGSAIDKLTQEQGINWAENKKEAMEALILKWAQNSRTFPMSTSLIIAHTNKEVQGLNEMVRIIRRQRGELGEKEFKCPTSKGDIFVSVGDRILFLGNDRELGLTNGLSGVLIEAEKDRFVVSIKGRGNKTQTVAFNPEKYHSYQLGYASTFYRSQGQTVDRAYVLHSPMMTNEMFYVGLTRHVRDVSYFISKEEVYCLADLKRQAVRTGTKELTIDYTTEEAINAQNQSQNRLKEIENLKQSDSFLNKIKGFGLETLGRVVNKAIDTKDHIQDRIPNKEFYNPLIPPPQSGSLPVEEVNIDEFQDFERSAREVNRAPLQDDPLLKTSKSEEREFSHLSRLFDKFKPEQREIASDYLKAMDKASSIKHVVDIEAASSSRDIRLSGHFREWQEACGLRNQAAYELLQKIPGSEIEKGLNPKSLEILYEQSSRYEASLLKKEGSKQNIDEELKANLESLLYKLYPEGPTSRTKTSFRFGSKGSLSVVHSGTKMGQFFDFEQNEGGGLLKLIQRELGLGKIESRAWAKDFLGIASDISMPMTFSASTKEVKADDSWVSIKPDPKVPAPKLEDLKEMKLGYYYDEVTRHAYKNENGELLYYVLRLKDKTDPERKITPPLSYGYWKSNPEKIDWVLKGFQSEKRSLYNLDLLKANPHANILVVEGEKTADQALSRLPENSYICITWPGGAGAVQKADWSPLQGRKVLIWPDNDKAGYEAGERVCQELKKIGVESIQLVSKEELSRHFPEKWDLADPLPTGVSENMIQKLAASSLEKGINPEKIMQRLALDSKDVVQKARINEILWRVDERLRPDLEKKHGVQHWKTHEEIIKETTKILSSGDQRKEELKEKFGVKETVLERLDYQISIREAHLGRKLKMREIDLLKGAIQQYGHIPVPKAADAKIADLTIDRMLIIACDRALSGMDVKDQDFIRSKKEVFSATEQLQNQTYEREIIRSKKEELGRDIARN